MVAKQYCSAWTESSRVLLQESLNIAGIHSVNYHLRHAKEMAAVCKWIGCHGCLTGQQLRGDTEHCSRRGQADLHYPRLIALCDSSVTF